MMGPSKKFQGAFIQLDNPSRSYFSGQLIEGRVVIQNAKPLKIKEVTILLDGTGKTRWTETVTHTTYRTRTVNGRTETVPQTHTSTITYSSQEQYVCQKISLAGDGSNLITIDKRRTFVYPFRFLLPTNLPSSFVNHLGMVSYFLEVELKRPLLKSNIRSCLPFTVNGVFDLNVEVGAGEPQEISGIKGSNFFACRKGKMGFVLKLPRRSGFVPGEILDFETEISNGSNQKITELKATLRQVCTFYAQGKTKVEKKTVCEVRGPEVDKGDHEMWIPVPGLTVPPLPPTRLGGLCRLIDVKYVLQFQMKLPGLSSNLTGELPVMIGTIPFRNTFERLRPPGFVVPQPLPIQNGDMGYSDTVPLVEPVPGPSSREPAPLPPQQLPASSAPFLQEYPDLPPPSYAEAIGAESFEWNEPVENMSKSQISLAQRKGVGDNGDESDGYYNAVPSAPPTYEFVPNYVTYKS